MQDKWYFFSPEKYLKLEIEVPFETLLLEAQKLKNLFTPHRESETHKGWKSLSLYGLNSFAHESYAAYNYKTPLEASKNYKWTTAGNSCPNTKQWIIHNFPSNFYSRIRFMLLEPNGFIDFHKDTEYSILENINVSLSNDQECNWIWKNGERLFTKPGHIYTFNLSYLHKVENNSKYPRYHLILSKQDSTNKWLQKIIFATTSNLNKGVFIKHEPRS